MSEEKSKRNFSKRLVIANCIGAWLVLGASVPYGETAALITHVFAFITTMTAIYTGIGHLDYRKFLDAAGDATERFKGSS